MKKVIVASLFMFLAMASPASAFERAITYYDLDETSSLASIAPDYSNTLILNRSSRTPNITEAEYVLNNAVILRHLSGNNEALSKEDLNLARKEIERKMRRENAEKMLANDLNFDAKVGKQEYEKAAEQHKKGRYQRLHGNDERFEKNFAELMVLDANKDGIVTYLEASAPIKGPLDIRRYGDKYEPIQEILRHDTNQDGQVSIGELEDISKRSFSTLDIDKDGKLSENEWRALSFVAGDRNFAPPEDCKFPVIPDEARLVVIGHDTGGAVPDVTTLGQEKGITAANIDIRASAHPLHLVLMGDKPVIYNFIGNVEQIERLYVLHYPDNGNVEYRGGVVNIPRNKIDFAPGSCFFRIGDVMRYRDRTQALQKIAAATDRKPSILAYEGQIGTLRIHDDRVEFSTPMKISADDPLLARADRKEASPLYTQYPEGVLHLVPDQVLAKQKVERYATLPGLAGLSDLVKQGVLKPVANTHDTYEILKPMKRFPAELPNGGRIKFLLGEGIPMPEGDIGNNCLIQVGQVDLAYSRRGNYLCNR